MFWIHTLFVMSLGISVLSTSTMVYDEVTTNSQSVILNTTTENNESKVRT